MEVTKWLKPSDIRRHKGRLRVQQQTSIAKAIYTKER